MERHLTKERYILGTVINDACELKIDDKYQKLDALSTRDIYWHIINQYRAVQPTSKNKWIENHREIELEEDDWAMIYELPVTLTKKQKYKSRNTKP